jgi:hypothetical protein
MKREDIREKLLPALTTQLDDLASADLCGAGSIVATIEQSDVRARIASVDRLACEFELISVTNQRLGSLSTEQLHVIADELSKQLSYLEERVIVLEVDHVVPQIRMRSKTPRVEGETRSYFEVQVGKLGLTLQRFSKQPGNHRTVVPAALTRDVFSRVCVDLMATVLNEA